MKKVLILTIVLFASVQISAKEKIRIEGSKSVELTYEEFADYDVKLSNSSGKQINVSVIDPNTGKQVSGFGLGPMGKATLYVRPDHILKLKNTSRKDISLSLDFVKRKPAKVIQPNEKMINFTMQNSSLKSIPLVIPDVMNPNLSPVSNSGVSLKVGQKIYYKKGMNKVLLMTIDESIKNGDKIDIAQLVKDLKKK